jgi:hypothetical protein
MAEENTKTGGYFWYENSQKIEEQVSKFIIPNRIGLAIRRFLCLSMLAYIILRLSYSANKIGELKFLTTWGVYLVFISFFLGSWSA